MPGKFLLNLGLPSEGSLTRSFGDFQEQSIREQLIHYIYPKVYTRYFPSYQGNYTRLEMYDLRHTKPPTMGRS